jgi:hypothetical protein
VTGALAGIVTTPPPPAYHGYYNHRHYGYYNHRHYARYAGRRNYCGHCRQAAGSTASAASTNAPSGY